MSDYDGDFDKIAALTRAGFQRALDAGGGLLFQTSAAKTLYTEYLSSFTTPDDRQHHTCSACQHFIGRYGALVVVDPITGEVSSAMWDYIPVSTIPELFLRAVGAMSTHVRKAKIVRPFLSSDEEWGFKATKGKDGHEWHHFSVTPPQRILYKYPVNTAKQQMAALREMFNPLRTSLEQFGIETMAQAADLMVLGKINRSERFLPMLRALLDLAPRLEGLKQPQRDALLWHAVCALPGGAANIKGGVLGTLLRDLKSGEDAGVVARKFNALVEPGRYQVSTTPLKAGNVKQAEKLVETLGLEPAFKRRYMTLAEVRALAVDIGALEFNGTPGVVSPLKSKAPPKKGMFQNLLQQTDPASAQALRTGAQVVSWTRLLEMLRGALAVEFLPGPGPVPLGALTTAVNPEAPPLFSWDDPAERNPHAWYRWQDKDAEVFGMTVHEPRRVLAVCGLPTLWGRVKKIEYQGSVIILEGVRDSHRTTDPTLGLGIFPEALRHELKPVRATVQAFSSQGQLEEPVDPDEPLAAGLIIRKMEVGQRLNLTFRVTTRAVCSEFIVDRWE